MKLEEMADLFDGLASFVEQFSTKSAMNDLRTVSECFRAFPGESVSSFCTFVVKAKEGRPTKSNGAAIDTTKVNDIVADIRYFLDHRQNYDDARIDTILTPMTKLKVSEIKLVGERIGCPRDRENEGSHDYNHTELAVGHTPIGSSIIV